ncbi:MAG: isoprenyl transferase [Deltaproteobacteria bacterium]|nr:isoprenyl transferase [Deltaproteobacteria bacterium]
MSNRQLPQHIAIIMDGNGRWAQERRQQRVFGHKKGAETVRQVVEVVRQLGIGHLTLYAFSTENWLRPKNEIKSLMELLLSFLGSEAKKLEKNDIRLNVIGDTSRLPPKARQALHDTMELTSKCKGLTLTIALSYGGRQEMLRAIKNIVIADRKSPIDLEEIDEDFFAKNLYTAGIPDPDLLIRTGREKRLSNFLLWQCAYAEFYFTDTLWPDFGEADILAAIAEYSSRKRRFGGIDTE